MKTTMTIQVRRFPVTVRDERTGEIQEDHIVLDKGRLQAAGLVGESSKELICRIYNREGYRVLDVGKAERKEITLELGVLLSVPDNLPRPQRPMEEGE